MKQKHFRRICTHFLLLLAFTLITGCGSSDSSGGGGENPSNTGAYNIGGTTRGLIGTGLTLQNNGADDLVITQNGTFQFSQQVEDGAPCNVTILSQPVDPPQVCEVVDGSQIISGSDIANVQIVCVAAFQDGFDSQIDALNWMSDSQYSRELVSGALELSLTATGEFGSNYISFTDTSCGSVSVDATMIDMQTIGNSGTDYGVRLESCGYHSNAEGEAIGEKIGDVFAAIVIKGPQSPFQAYYYVFKCLDELCNDHDSIELLTPNEVDSNSLGDVALGESVTLTIDWNRQTPGQFSFQLDDDPVVTFDPVAAGAQIAAAEPNAPQKYMGVLIDLFNPDDIASVVANFDNIWVNDVLYDDFNTMIYPDVSFWGMPQGKTAIDNGRLMLEVGKEYTGDLLADTRWHNTELVSHENIIPNEDVVETDIVLDSSTALMDITGTPIEAYAVVEMGFRPLGAQEKDWTHGFLIQAGLKEDPSGTMAEASLVGCVDSSCGRRLKHESQVFNTVVNKDATYHFTIEYVGSGIINITLNNSETMSFDVSAIPEFVPIEFRRMELRTSIRGTDSIGENAFVRAYFDNVRVGTPF